MLEYTKIMRLLTSLLNHIESHYVFVTLTLLMNKEHAKGTFDTIKTPSRIKLESTGTKPESGPAILHNNSIVM